jgi:hypothetical protein
MTKNAVVIGRFNECGTSIGTTKDKPWVVASEERESRRLVAMMDDAIGVDDSNLLSFNGAHTNLLSSLLSWGRWR